MRQSRDVFSKNFTLTGLVAFWLQWDDKYS